MLRRNIAAAFRRKVKLFEADINNGTFFQKYPQLKLSDVYWLANDTQYLGVLRTHEAFETLLNVEKLMSCAERAAAQDESMGDRDSDVIGGVAQDLLGSYRGALWTHFSSNDDIALAYKALSSLHPSLRNVPRTLEALGHLNTAALDRIATMNQKVACTIIKQIPTLNVTNTRSIDVALALCNFWFPKLDQFDNMNDVRAFLQTVGSQFTRVECTGILSQLDTASLAASVTRLLTRRHEIRRLAPTVMVTYSKLHASGLPLDTPFTAALDAYMVHVVRRSSQSAVPMSSGEALRVLSAISRVRLVRKSTAFENEASELLAIASTDIANLDGPELAMMMSCVTFHFTNATAPAAVASSSKSNKTWTDPSTKPTTAGGEQNYVRPEKLLKQMKALLSTMSFRGFLSCCRSATLLAHTQQVTWDEGLCDEVARRCKAMLLNEQEFPTHGRNRLYPTGEQPTRRNVIGAVDRNSMLFEKLTVLVATNAFVSRTKYSRQTTHHIIASLLEQHPYELSATNISLLFSSLAAAFGIPVATGEIQTAPGQPPLGPLAVRQRSHVHEIDPNLLTILIEKAAMGTRLSQYAYSTLLRNFCRLGLEYTDVAAVVQRILSMRYESNNQYNAEDEYQHRRGVVRPAHTGDSTESPDQVMAMASSHGRSSDLSWEMRSRGLYLMSPHMSEIVFASLAALRCEHPTVMTYVAWSILMHSGGVPPQHLLEPLKQVALTSPLIASALNTTAATADADRTDTATAEGKADENIEVGVKQQ
jgi:hypothetical protein